MTDNSKLIKKIRALLATAARTDGNFAEAMAAAGLAARLMDQYQISAAEVDSAETMPDGFETVAITPRKVWENAFYTNIVCAVAKYTGTYTYFAKESNKHKARVYKFHGRVTDVVFAEWLTKQLADFVFAGAADMLALEPWLTRKQINSSRAGYIVAAADSISKRLQAMLSDREKATVGTNLPALWSRSDAAKADAKSKLALMRPASNKQKTVYAPKAAIEAGAARGEAAQFNRGVRGATKTLLLS